MEFNYQQIKQLAKAFGRPVTDLIALAAQNDPFYQGTPTSLNLAEWFAGIYYEHHSRGERVHLRRMHYLIVSLGLCLPNGAPYENTENAWATLGIAAKAARYLHLLPFENIVDKKNDPPEDYSTESARTPGIDVEHNLYNSDLQLPDFPTLPTYDLHDFEGRQRYHMEIWCEKTTMNDVLQPLCRRYNMTLQTGAGELSITACSTLAERIRRNNKPTRILYVSDFDPAGQSMPVAVSRKLEYFVRNFHLDALDIRLYPVVLTAEQVQSYRLPRTPIKESEKRKERFEQQYGKDAVELDALEALHAGELRRILTRIIEQYYDTSLDARVRARRDDLESELDAHREGILSSYQDDIDAAETELEVLRAEVGDRLDAYSQRVQHLWRAIRDTMETETPALRDIPEAREADEIGDGLYNSQRSYLDQIAVYKAFQGKAHATEAE